jgi:hypothetical protein
MRRALAVLVGACFILVLGCGEYDRRLETTLAEMRYRKRLDNSLTPAAKGLLEKNLIYLRPPRSLQGPTETFSWAVVEPGRFDLENSFIDQQKSESLHVLARIKRPKSADAKKKTVQPEVVRGDFNTEVIELVRTVYGAELDPNSLKAETKSHGNRSNTFKSKTLDLNAKEVHLCLYENKNSPYEVALVFEYPKESHDSISPRIGLCLESFAVGELARRAFSGGGDIEGGEGATEGGAGPPI